MPQELKPLSLIHIGKGEILPTPIIGLWGNKNGLPSMKVKEFENVQSETGLRGCKWSSLKATVTETPLPHPFLRESLVLRARPSLSELCGRRFAERFTVEVTFQEKTVGR